MIYINYSSNIGNLITLLIKDHGVESSVQKTSLVLNLREHFKKEKIKWGEPKF